MSTVAILAYHRVGSPGPSGWETWFQIPESTFASHLATLADGGWEVLGADRFLNGLADPTEFAIRDETIVRDDLPACPKKLPRQRQERRGDAPHEPAQDRNRPRRHDKRLRTARDGAGEAA